MSDNDAIGGATPAPAHESASALIEQIMRLAGDERMDGEADGDDRHACEQEMRALLNRLAALAPASGGEARKEALPTMEDAIAAGNGTLHGAIDYWQERALSAERRLTTPTTQAAACTCPSGDGSLSWPCPTHPPQAARVSDAMVERAEAARVRFWETDSNYPETEAEFDVDPAKYDKLAMRAALEDALAAAGSAPEGDLLALQRFAVGILGDGEIGSLDGGDIQDTAEACGLLVPTEVSASCGEGCVCASYGDFPMTCYRRSPILFRAYKADHENSAPTPPAAPQEGRE